jgi:hypothetical protein
LLYTFDMARLILATMFLLNLAIPTFAQVKVAIPPHLPDTFGRTFYFVHDEIHAKVENIGNSAVTFCVEFGQTSVNGSDVESTPSPFWVQRRDNGKWGTLMIGPDVGSAKAAVVLEAGKSREFPLRLNDTGRMRLRLNYWRGSIPNLDCHAPPKNLKLATSAVFFSIPTID